MIFLEFPGISPGQLTVVHRSPFPRYTGGMARVIEQAASRAAAPVITIDTSEFRAVLDRAMVSMTAFGEALAQSMAAQAPALEQMADLIHQAQYGSGDQMRWQPGDPVL